MRQPSLAKREALYVHARLAPSRTTTEHGAFEASALSGRAAAASVEERDASPPPRAGFMGASAAAAVIVGVAMRGRFAAMTGMARGDGVDACLTDRAEPGTACHRASIESGEVFLLGTP